MKLATTAKNAGSSTSAAIKRALHSLNDKRDAKAEDKDRKDWPEATHDPGARAEDCPQDDDGKACHKDDRDGAGNGTLGRSKLLCYLEDQIDCDEDDEHCSQKLQDLLFHG